MPKKISNFAENLAVKTDSQLLVIERRHTIGLQDTIQLNMLKMKVKSYRFEFTGQGFDPALTAFLEDSYYNTRIPLNINGTSTYDFTVANIPGSWNPTRFRIVFSSAAGAPLPIDFSTVKAYQQNNDIAVEWKVENEKNRKQYEVEKSIDGQHFVLVSTVIAKNINAGANYQWLDVNASVGSNYYRIRSVDIDGAIQYSNIVKVDIAGDKPTIVIYPNPIANGTINLSLINQPDGIYGLRLMNELGQTLMSKKSKACSG